MPLVEKEQAKGKKANRLINEKSPYLLQHAYNPIDWYAWSDDAFQKAKREDKPVLLSSGYSCCHWCHVMERESFEDEEVAEILNKYFVCIKVDREERPDIDSIYMSFCQAVTGHGGWPLTVILTPDKRPFFAGTYFPKKSKYGQPGFIEVLYEIIDAWKNRRNEIEKSSVEIIEALNSSVFLRKRDDLSEDFVHQTYKMLNQFFDYEYGGFGYAPKFPCPHNLLFLLRYYAAYGEKEALQMVEKTLECMYKGGIFDHIGFGFSRYSTDQKWLVPHFEKMLYDNALLIIAYIEAFAATGNYLYAEIAQKILTYVFRDMKDEQGGFYSAQDADSEGVEGKFYAFGAEEIKNILGEEDSDLFSKYYNIKPSGNFEGKNIPNLIGVTLTEIQNDQILKYRLSVCREKIYNYRQKREHPFKDDKILTGWNGLMIAAASISGRILNIAEYIEAAKKSAEFIMKYLVNQQGRLLARYREREADHFAYIDDYAFFIWGLIELYQASFESKYLKKATEFTKDMVDLFWDDKEGGFFLYGKDSEQLYARPKEIYDGAMPSGNSVAAMNLLRLARLTGDNELEERAISLFKVFGGDIKQNPYSYTHFASAFLFANKPPKHIIIKGNKKNEDTKLMIEQCNKIYLPFTTVIIDDNSEMFYELVPFAKNLTMNQDKATAYICENYACNLPITDFDVFIKML